MGKVAEKAHIWLLHFPIITCVQAWKADINFNEIEKWNAVLSPRRKGFKSGKELTYLYQKVSVSFPSLPALSRQG